MTVRRSAAAAAAAGIAAVAGVWPTAAHAHGAPASPGDRATVCAVAGSGENLAVCRAALAANGRPFGNSNNLRVSGVDGNDKQLIPDGQLCSAGLADFRGLDLPRADWPATTAISGSALTVRYRATIAHPGSFRVYLTTAGYDPAMPLHWSDLGTEPILMVADPPLRDGSYRMTAQLPAGLSGRHLLYTVWQVSDSRDTYYSCSDLLLKTRSAAGGAHYAPAPPSAKATPKPPAASPTKAASTAEPSEPLSVSAGPVIVADPPVVEPGLNVARESWLDRPGPSFDNRVALGQQLVSAALVVLVGVAAGLAVIRMRASRAAQRLHRRPEKR